MVNRDYAISSFKKEKYHVVRLNAGGVSALSERLNDEAAAQQMKAACEKSQAACTSLALTTVVGFVKINSLTFFRHLSIIIR